MSCVRGLCCGAVDCIRVVCYELCLGAVLWTVYGWSVMSCVRGLCCGLYAGGLL